MDSAAREALAKRVLARSRADQTEIFVACSDSALTRFTRGIANQNVASVECTISVRAIVDGKTGVAATSAIDDAALDELVERAIAMAHFGPSDPNVPILPSGGAANPPVDAFLQRTADADPLERATICDGIMKQAESAGAWCAGYASSSCAGITIANSSGALASFDGTDAQANVKIIAQDSSGFAERYSTDIAAIDGGDVGARAAKKALASAHPRGIEPGDWTVILEPPAFGELLIYLADHFSAQTYDEGSSFFSGALGQTFFDANFTLGDDYTHPLAPGMPFDYEAQPKSILPLVERGVVRNFVTDAYYAKKLGCTNTGHALPAPNAYGPQALNLVVAPGTESLDALIARTTRGLLISRFWYIRTVDQKRAIVTGMTRDGTFLIEDGEIVGGVRNLRFNQSILDALKGVSFSNEQRRTGQYSYSLVVPSARIERFTFTSTTEF